MVQTIKQLFGENITELVGYVFKNKIGISAIYEINGIKLSKNLLEIEIDESIENIYKDLGIDYYG